VDPLSALPPPLSPPALPSPPASSPASAAVATQAWVVVSQLEPGQSPFTLQPPRDSQVPSTLQAVERHTVLPVPVVHGPSPLA
jgi:hypothetical protein